MNGIVVWLSFKNGKVSYGHFYSVFVCLGIRNFVK